MIPAEYLAGLGAILFCIGLVGVFTRANAIIVLMCVEIMLNAVNLNFVAGALHHGDVTGWVFTAIAIAIVGNCKVVAQRVAVHGLGRDAIRSRRKIPAYRVHPDIPE